MKLATGRSSQVVQCAMPGLDASSSMAGSAVVLHVHCTGALHRCHGGAALVVPHGFLPLAVTIGLQHESWESYKAYCFQ